MTELQKLQEQFEKMNWKVDRIYSLLQANSSGHQTHLDDWLTEEQTRVLLNRRTTSLWKLRKEGKIIFSNIEESIYYSRQSILDYLNAHRSDKGRKTLGQKIIES